MFIILLSCFRVTVSLNFELRSNSLYNSFAFSVFSFSIACMPFAFVHRLRVRASNPGYLSAADSVSIFGAPSNPIAKNNSPVCYGDTLKFSTSSDTLTNFVWTGPHGFLSTLQNPFIANVDTPSEGLYIVTAYLFGCPAKPDSIGAHIIKITPSVTINTGLSDTICAGTSVTFIATGLSGGSAASYIWQKNGVTVSSGSSIYTTAALSNNDTIKVLFTSSLVCANPIQSIYKTVMDVKPIPARSIASSNSPVCSTDPISLRATTSSSGATYAWIGPAGFSSTLQNPTITSADSFKAGLYIVHALLNGCISPSDTDTVVVVASVIPGVSLGFNPSDTICQGQPLTFTATPVNGGSSPAYKWYLNGTLIPGFTSNTYTVDTLKDGDGVICAMNSSLTCPRPITTTYSQVITVNQMPSIINISGNSPLCSSDTVRLSRATKQIRSNNIQTFRRGINIGNERILQSG